MARWRNDLLVSDVLLMRLPVSRSARETLISLSSRMKNGKCFVSENAMAEDWGVHANTVSAAVGELSEHGYVKVGKRGNGNTYTITPKFIEARAEFIRQEDKKYPKGNKNENK